MLLFYVLVKVCEIPTSTYAPVAQSVEQLPFKEMVVGSIPTGRTVQKIQTSLNFLTRCETELYFASMQNSELGS